jgi:hypothetical protein
MVVDELVTLLGIDIAASALPNVTKFNSKLDTVMRYAQGVTAAVLATGAAIVAFTEKMSSSAAGIATFSHYTGMSAESIQKWSYAVEQAGGHAEGLKSDMVSLEKSLNPLMPGRYNEGLFMMFGQGYKDIKNSEQALIQISAKMQGMSKQRQLQWGEMLGFTPDTMLLVQQGPKKIQQALGEIKGSVLSQDQVERAFRFMQIWNKLKVELYKTGETLVTLLLPAVQKMLVWFDHWLNLNQKLIGQGLHQFVKGIGEGFERFGNAISGLRQHLPILNKLFTTLLDPKIIGGTVFVALTGIATVLGVIALKYAAIGAAVLTVVGALEDFSTGFGKDEDGIYRSTGKDTMFGRTTDWVNDRLPGFMKDEKHKYVGSTPGQSVAVEMWPKIKELFDAASGKNIPIDAQTQRNMDVKRGYLEHQGNSGQYTQHNEININSNTPYDAGVETSYQLKRLWNRDLTGQNRAGNGQ